MDDPLEKPFYTAIEAAIRWCGLFEHEAEILSRMGKNFIPSVTMFPEWPCLRVNTEKILDAVQHMELTCYDGNPRSFQRSTIQKAVSRFVELHANLTVRHSDLKEWMIKHYPSQKPVFLFDEMERVNSDFVKILQVNRDTLKVKLDDEIAKYQVLHENYKTLSSERDVLLKTVDNLAAKLKSLPSERVERTYQNIIVALLDCILGNAPGVGKHQDIKNQSQLINIIVEKYGDYEGLSERTLKHKFVEAKKNFDSQI